MSFHRRILVALLKAADLAVVVACLAGAHVLTSPRHDWPDLLTMPVELGHVLFVLGYLAWWHVILLARGLYGSYRLASSSRELRDLGLVVLLAVAPLLLVLPLSPPPFSFAFVAAFGVSSFAALASQRTFLRAFSRRLRQHGRNLRKVVIVGAGADAYELATRLARRDDLGYRVIDVIDVAPGEISGPVSDTVVQRVQGLIESRPIDEVFLALPLDRGQRLARTLIAACEEQGVPVRLIAPVADLQWARACVDELEGQPVLTIQPGPAESLELLVKRGIDLVGAVTGLILCAPLCLIVAILIRLDSPGPILFVQERVGLNRRRFRFYKFRTMVVDAEAQQARLEPLNEAQGPVFKIQNDPRVTRLGKWLRRLSIDELPQLLNVVRGDMSLVGPRPLPVRDVERMDVRWHKRRFSVKPGVTCLWQVQSRAPHFDEWIRMDMEYIDHWSLGLDLKILLKTIPAVWSGQGAH